jgi:hypothetical protein
MDALWTNAESAAMKIHFTIGKTSEKLNYESRNERYTP